MNRLRRAWTDGAGPELKVAALLLAGILVLGMALTWFGTPGIDIWISRAASVQRVNAQFWLALSNLGGGETRVAVGLLAAAFLWLRKRGRDGLILLTVVLVQTGTNSALKALFGRVRPDLYAHLDTTFDQSFPSGHSAQNAALYLLIALLIDRRLLWLAVPLVLMIGVSRVVLGVHWPTDVLAGWAEGLAFALIGLRISHGLGAIRKA